MGQLWVIEKNGHPGDHAEERSRNAYCLIDVVGITGTAFTNHTLEHLLEMCHPRALFVLLGDTTPMFPILFDCGIDSVCGVKVVNLELA